LISFIDDIGTKVDTTPSVMAVLTLQGW